MTNKDLPALLRAIAGGSQAKKHRHDVILTAAADEIERLRQLERILRYIVNSSDNQQGSA